MLKLQHILLTKNNFNSQHFSNYNIVVTTHLSYYENVTFPVEMRALDLLPNYGIVLNGRRRENRVKLQC